MILWLQRTPKASWRDVVGALRQMRENTEAERIELQYIVRPAHASKLYTIQYSFVPGLHGPRNEGNDSVYIDCIGVDYE